MNRWNTIALGALVSIPPIIIYQSCGTDTTHQRKTYESVTSGPTESPAPTPTSFAPATLDGTWAQSTCAADGLLTDFFSKEKITFNGVSFKRVTEYYIASPCSGSGPDAEILELEIQGSFALAEMTTTPPDSFQFNISLTSAAMTPKHSNAVTPLNQFQVCGLTGWQVNVAVGVIGKTCTFMSTAGVATNLSFASKQLYDVTKIENGSLFFGKRDSSHDGVVPGKRPVELGSAFTKK